jgi:hypothetical protein
MYKIITRGPMQKIILLICCLFTAAAYAQQQKNFRPPSVPLVTHDPYFSIWSLADKLTDRETVHWTGARQPLHSIVRVDGKSYRLMGADPSHLEPLTQTGLSVYPTRTVYKFKNELINLTLTFTSPVIASDLDLLSRPITYITWGVTSNDGKQHKVQIYLDCGSEVAANNEEQTVKFDRKSIDGLSALTVGTTDQKILGKSGDDLRIDWGYAYLAAPNEQKPVTAIGSRNFLTDTFEKEGMVKDADNPYEARKISDNYFFSSVVYDLGIVGKTKITRWIMLGYDDIYSIRYFGSDLKAWWAKEGTTFDQLLKRSASEYSKVSAECEKFDKELITDLTTAGGDKYAQMCALVYRQCLAAHKLVADKNGMPLIFAKENFSNGCIATVDVIYPASPFFFLFNPTLAKAMLKPLLAYSESGKWKFPFAPHDLGTYPYATGQVYGGGEKTENDQMPIEETGNMLIMLAAVSKSDGNADFVKDHWNTIEKWADYLISKGFDPENQLCTDDFAGHLAHNINLSAKAIVAVGSYAMLCDMLGKKDKAAEYKEKASAMAKDWIKLSGEGDHTKLAFNRPDSWSQKYNLVWDKLLGLNLFPANVLQKEIKFYKTKQAKYGLPLDNRERYTKNDWITWTATLSDSKKDFEAIFNPVYDFSNSTPQRVPVSDWYIVDNAYQRGFQARSVVGGFFIKMLDGAKLWDKWSSKGTKLHGSWAPVVLQK